MAVTQVPLYTGNVPSRQNDTPAEFADNADDWVAYQESIIAPMNTQAEEVNQLAEDAEAAADTSAANANFKGNWSDLTGALDVPASVRHNDKNWQLLNDLVDVTASEPGVSADWAITSDINSSSLGDYTDYAFDTVSEMTAFSPSVGSTLRIKERGDYVWDVEAAGTPDGFGILDAGSGNTAVLRVIGAADVIAFGAKGDYNPATGVGTDDSPSFQAAINSADKVVGPARRYLISNSWDATNRFNGVTLEFEHVGISNGGAILYGNTGESAVIDYAGSQKISHRNLGIETAVNAGNPSKLGLLHSRTSTSQFSQFNTIENSVIDIASDPTAFSGAGSLGIMCKAAEIFTFRDTYALGDTGLAIMDTDTRFGITSDYQDLVTGVPTSNSTYKFEGNTVFDSKNEVGVPLYIKAGVNVQGMCYVNGDAGTGGDTYGLELEGICRGFNLTIFTEFAKRHALIEATFNDSILNCMGSFGPNRNIDTGAGFVGWTNVEVNFISTISGAFTSPDYWIDGSSDDVMTNVRVSAPQEPVVDWVVPSNTTFNRKRGWEYSSPDNTILAKDQIRAVDSAYNDLPFQVGNYRMWMATNNAMLWKTSDPTAQDDGTSVGFGNFQSTVGAAGGASALPANPSGYAEVVINGTTLLMPYYNKP